ncbi:MAG: glutamine-hydrolyzing GMP synthase [Candidatus Firestonebacteria bacterium RIFOXYC2_FULL_39_67]|nr:MAG: glutamine-hydrolyzing GMP synthase [Candidatus Firestonebacteria bacterium RIFOXYD2_FULL_39_29]OGF55113.1 MAG: glutamine-hydrolyzing GMP synthase [Candidatus Firestonebacteria bacterium RIFOXYC2_FULL_39_67]OGF57821.1 MAG: glutamine-hydrolyzing GMP synthase [Candidatus Firestonebacteria bacterium RifOxyC12_full_39_7]
MQEAYTKEFIAILDYGSQYNQLIARRVRENNVYCEILPPTTTAEQLKKSKKLKGIILSGGPASVYAEGAPKMDKEIFDLGVPILGICYGMQLISHTLGGKVTKADKREYGLSKLLIKDFSDLLWNLRSTLDVWMSHGDQVTKLPPGFEPIAYTMTCPFGAVRNRHKKIFGVQFHPEVVHTQNGKDIIRNFLVKICGCTGDWTMKAYIKDAMDNVKKLVGDKKVLCGLSGGVDSSVAAVLIHKAIGDNLHCVFVNNGVLRKNEENEVLKTFRDGFKLNLHYVDASERFLKKLKGITNPEEKRKIIGGEFIRVFEEEAKRLGDLGGMEFLAQGTLYPDVIESVSTKGPSAVIKSHHNVGGLPKDLKFKLIEPLRELFKDEVRVLGKELRIPDEILWRQPFPGPGLAVRILGEVTKENVEILKNADHIITEEIKKAGLYRTIWQSFGVLLPVKTVGVMGDERTYENVIALRAVESQDGMTADWVKLPYEVLNIISNRIVNEVRGVNRVVYDISSKPPSTIEWE